jgi:hypothetical protein
MRGFVRPKPVVVSPKAMVPKATHITPAPNQFSHALARRAPYYFEKAARGRTPDGYFAKGTKVLVLGRRGAYCRVADRRGLYVEIPCDALRPLAQGAGRRDPD